MHFAGSRKYQEAKKELETRDQKKKTGQSTSKGMTIPLAPLQIPNISYPPTVAPTPVGPGMFTPLPALPSSIGLGSIGTPLNLEVPAIIPGPSNLPITNLIPATPLGENLDISCQSKRPRLDIDVASALYTPILPSGANTPAHPFFAEVLEPPKLKWSVELQEQFRAELCMLMIATNTAWWAVDHPYVHWWFSRWVPGAQVPGRKLLSGPVLDDLSRSVEQEMKSKVCGKFATGQCDGWKNIAKTSLIASMINVEYVVRTDSKMSSLPVLIVHNRPYE